MVWSMAPTPQHRPPRAIGYLRVSTAEQADSGAGLSAQLATLHAEAARRGWDLDFAEDAGYSAASMQRPALTAALGRLDAGDADILVVTKLDRLSRSVGDFAAVIAHSARRGWSVVCLDLGVDTSTPTGELLANVVASTAQYERRLIGQRTRDALAARKAAGVRLGRPQSLPESVVRRVITEHRAGRSLAAIAVALQADGITTAHGGARWHPSTVRAVLRSQAASALR